QQVEAEQIEDAEAGWEKQRAEQRLAGMDGDGDGKGRSKGKDGPGHIGTDERILGGHENLGLAGLDHLGGKLLGSNIGHRGISRILWGKPGSRYSAAICMSTSGAMKMVPPSTLTG